MKIIKKHAVAITKFIKIFLDNGFYGADPSEEVLLGKVLGFGQHNKLVEPTLPRGWKGAREVKVIKCARIDLTEDEAWSILAMVSEVREDETVEECTKFMDSTLTYLNKKFMKEEK